MRASAAMDLDRDVAKLVLIVASLLAARPVRSCADDGAVMTGTKRRQT